MHRPAKKKLPDVTVGGSEREVRKRVNSGSQPSVLIYSPPPEKPAKKIVPE